MELTGVQQHSRGADIRGRQRGGNKRSVQGLRQRRKRVCVNTQAAINTDLQPNEWKKRRE